jgi:glycosyltransferase involved in cell wall biosynthesis
MTEERKLKVVIVTETYAKRMGYAPAALSKALASVGADVHVITPRLAPYFDNPHFQEIYGTFSAASHAPGATEEVDGYTVHYVGHRKRLGYVRLVGLRRILAQLRPDIVQTFVAIGWIPFDLAIRKPLLGYQFFTGSHTTASVFPLAQHPVRLTDPAFWKSMILRAAPGRLISLAYERCFGATVDCADVAVRFFGVPPRKMTVAPLGVDTDVFFPDTTEKGREERAALRASLGVADDELLCVYSGRFTKEKNPLILAQAVAKLRAAGHRVAALFVGNGPQESAISVCVGSILHPFAPFQELGTFYRAADVAVFPTQESMSMLDAAACGLPIIVNDTLQATERIDGNGITYRLNDVDDLVRAIDSLRDASRRQQLGSAGAQRMASQFSWTALARNRMAVYRQSLSAAGTR